MNTAQCELDSGLLFDALQKFRRNVPSITYLSPDRLGTVILYYNDFLKKMSISNEEKIGHLNDQNPLVDRVEILMQLIEQAPEKVDFLFSPKGTAAALLSAILYDSVPWEVLSATGQQISPLTAKKRDAYSGFRDCLVTYLNTSSPDTQSLLSPRAKK